MKAAARQWLVTVAALGNRTFAEKSGGEKKSETSKWRDGGAVYSDVITAPPEISDVVLTNAYDPAIDAAMISTLVEQVGVLVTTITQIPLYGDMTRTPGVKPLVYSGAVLTAVTPPEPNANSGDPSTYKLTFSVNALD